MVRMVPPSYTVVIFAISQRIQQVICTNLAISLMGALAISSQGSQWGQFYDQLSERDLLLPWVFFSHGDMGIPIRNRHRYRCIWVNYNDLTATSLEIMVNQGNHPQMALIQVGELL